MSASQGIPIPLVGCRHDVLGHALKAIGVLRALAQCAPKGKTDPDAEGWWDTDRACFRIYSPRYPTMEKLRDFFANHYEPTPIIAAWNKSGGVTDKIAVTIAARRETLDNFRKEREAELVAFGMKKSTKVTTKGELKFTLADPTKLADAHDLALKAKLRLSSEVATTRGVAAVKVSIAIDSAIVHQFRKHYTEQLAGLGFSETKQVSKDGEIKFALDTARATEVTSLVNRFRPDSADPESPTTQEAYLPTGIASKDESPTVEVSVSIPPVLQLVIAPKESGKKDGVLPEAARLLASSGQFQRSLQIARSFTPRFQNTDDDAEFGPELSQEFRDVLEESLGESFDSLCSIHFSRLQNNPLFFKRGRPGDKVNTDIFLNFWEYFLRFKRSPNEYVDASLFGIGIAPTTGISVSDLKGKGTPYFPDAIKRYNQGTEWVTEDAPFCPLDYVLAIEGAVAMRGATSKRLNAHSRPRAAFPFVFDGADTMSDENGKLVGSEVVPSFWFPLWNRPTTYHELQSFILDSQTQLPTKECRFSGDFARAVRSQGTDAGIAAFQEFRFKLKGASVPWTTAGRFVPCTVDPKTTLLNELLAPIDANGFLEEFKFDRKKKDDLHPYRLPVLEAIDDAIIEPTPGKIMEVLCRLANINADLARSKSLREKVNPSGRVSFIPALSSSTWDAALGDFGSDDPEFDIARALASITGHERQPDNKCSEVEPFLGSLVPLKRKGRDWHLPMKPEPPSAQAVWSGNDLCFDLSAILARRHMDSAKDERPALVGRRTASLKSILQFLRGELDVRRISRLVMGLSLLDWQSAIASCDRPNDRNESKGEDDWEPIPLPYAALRSLIEIGIDVKREVIGIDGATTLGPKARSQQAIAMLCQRTPNLVSSATEEALRRLAIIGVRNCYGEQSRNEKQTLRGRDIVSLANCKGLLCDADFARRLAASVLIPLDWRDRWMIFRSITLPQTSKR
jgi:CRISPR-associated protein Csx17